jgi:hypothetical protein
MRFAICLAASARIVKSLENTNKGIKRQALKLTPAAVARIKELISKQPEAVALKVKWRNYYAHQENSRLVSSKEDVMDFHIPWTIQRRKDVSMKRLSRMA